MFKLKCCSARGEDEEIEIKIIKVFKDHWGPFVIYKSINGEFHNVSINQILELKYKMNDLRVLHFQIPCATLKMIELKEKVTIALLKREYFQLEAFSKNNSEFQVIQAEEET